MTLIIKTTGIEDYLDGGEAYIKCLVLGQPSAGKTRSASFWPKPIFADCEKGRMSIADRKVPYAEITSIADMDALLRMLKAECRKPVADRRYQTLVIDTIDAYQRIVIQERLDSEKKESLSGWGDWGYLDAKMTQFIAKLQGLPMNIVANVHVKELQVGDDDSKLSITGVKLKGDLKDQIAADFDLVGHMGTYWEAENGERVLKRGIQWHPDPTKPILKDRSGQLPKWTPVRFTDEDYSTLFTTLISHLDSLEGSQQVEELPTDAAITQRPVPPQKGGPVAGAPLAPAETPRKAAKAAPPKKAAAAPPAGQPPTDVAVPPAAKPAVPPAAKPEVAGADTAPVAEPAQAPATPEPEAPQAPADEQVPGQMTVEEVAAALGAEEVASEQAAAESPTTDDAPADAEASTAEVAQVEQQATAPLCGTSSNDGEEGQPGAVSGCGAPVDVDADLTQIAMFKTRTYLCPACYAAWRATTKK